MSFPIHSNIQIVPTLSYQRFCYTGQNARYGLPDVVGIRSSESGEPLSIYETSLAFRFITSSKLIRPFLTIGGSVYIMHVGEIFINTWLEQHPQSFSTNLYQGTGQTMTKGAFALGYGFNVPLNPSLAIQLEGRLSETFNGDASFLCIISTVQIRL
jgi:hypothetical protein